MYTFLLPNIYKDINSVGASLICNVINEIIENTDAITRLKDYVNHKLFEKNIHFEIVPQLTRIYYNSATPFIVFGFRNHPSINLPHGKKCERFSNKNYVAEIRNAIVKTLSNYATLNHSPVLNFKDLKYPSFEDYCKQVISSPKELILKTLVYKIFERENIYSPLSILYELGKHESRGALV